MDTPLSFDASSAVRASTSDESSNAFTPPGDGNGAARPLPPGIDRGELEREVAAALTDIDMRAVADDTSAAPTERRYEPGELIRGKVLSCTDRDVLIDLGGKVQGVVSRDEFLPGYEPPVGLELNVLVDTFDAEHGLVRLSKKRADVEAMWRNLKVGDVVEGIVSGMNKGGLEVAVGGVRAFVPASQVDVRFVKDITEMFGKPIRAEVTRIERGAENLVLSRRAVLEREAAEAKTRMMSEIQVGDVRRGRVRSLADYGAFIDLGGVDGLLHVSELSYGRINHPSEVVKVGDEIEVKVLKVQAQKGKISLGLKQLRPNPWESVAERIAVGATMKGRVVRHADFGAFVELESGVEGLVPLSELSWNQRVRHPREICGEGDVVDVAVLSVDAEKHRIGLSIKQVAGDPWADVEATYPVGSKHMVKVMRTAQFGAFVELAPGVEGMIHISELAPSHVKTVTDVVQAGQEVEARVLRVERESRRIGLSLRPEPAPPSPEEIKAAQKAAAAVAAAAAKKSSKPRRGGLEIGWADGVLKLDPSKYAR